MLIFTLSEHPDRTGRPQELALATWHGREYWAVGAGAVAGVAKQLVSRGCPEQTWQVLDAGGQPLLFGASLFQLAQAAAR